MKKILLYTFGILLFTLTSCMEEAEVWDSAVLEYAGSYKIELRTEDGAIIADYSSGFEMDIYNTAANKQNEVWIDDHEELFPLKSKFFFTGNPSSFSSQNTDFNDDLPVNEGAIVIPEDKPTEAGQRIITPFDDEDEEHYSYTKATILEGKILSMAATTPGGNTSDSIYFKIQLYVGKANLISKTAPEESWTDEEKPEYYWDIESVTNDPNQPSEVYVVSGYRKTGFEEDEL